MPMPLLIPHPPMLRRFGGFTLLEILIVVAIIGVGSVVLMAGISAAMPGRQLREAANQVAAEMRLARAQALVRGRSQRFELDLQTKRWKRDNGERVIEGEISDAIDVKATTAREESPGGQVAAIRFFPEGASTGGRIVFARGDAAWRVDVGWLTGQISVHRGAGDRDDL